MLIIEKELRNTRYLLFATLIKFASFYRWTRRSRSSYKIFCGMGLSLIESAISQIKTKGLTKQIWKQKMKKVTVCTWTFGYSDEI